MRGIRLYIRLPPGAGKPGLNEPAERPLPLNLLSELNHAARALAVYASWLGSRRRTPRKARSRLVASLDRTGLVARKVPPQGFRDVTHSSLSPCPGFTWRTEIANTAEGREKAGSTDYAQN